jgi:hypothetical protein
MPMIVLGLVSPNWYTGLPSALPSGYSLSASALLTITTGVVSKALGSIQAISSGRKLRPATSFRPIVASA